MSDNNIIAERVADAWLAEERMWSGPHWNGAGMSGFWEARRRDDPANPFKMFGPETIRLVGSYSDEVTRELADLVRQRCARAAIAAMRDPGRTLDEVDVDHPNYWEAAIDAVLAEVPA